MTTLTTESTQPTQKRFDATNWSEPSDSFSALFYERYKNQIWFPEEIPLMNDMLDWKSMTELERQVYIHFSAGLNLLDTIQGEIGMPSLHAAIAEHDRKVVIQFQGMMEDVHAQSYSYINKTFLTSTEEAQSFAWSSTNVRLQRKARLINNAYCNGTLPHKLIASVILESALFYSGFFFPLYLAGQGRMVSSGELFNLIIRDEALHGVYIGLLFQEIANPSEYQEWFRELAMKLYENEIRYTEELYDSIGLTEKVKPFIRYNFNVAADNLGLERLFPEESIDPTVMNGLKLGEGVVGTHDFFSTKGSGYSKLKVEAVQDDDFAVLEFPK